MSGGMLRYWLVLAIGDLLAPEQGALGHVECDQVAVCCAANQTAVLQRHAAIGGRKDRTLLVPVVRPSLAARRRVDGDGCLVDSQIHHALVDQWVGLRGAGVVRAINAYGPQLAGVLRRDLGEVDEALTVVVLAGVEPILLVPRRMQQLVLCRALGRWCACGWHTSSLCACGRRACPSERFEIGDHVGPVGRVRQRHRHRRSRNLHGRRGEEFIQCLVVPHDSGLCHRGRIGVASEAARPSSDDFRQRRSEAVFPELNGVTRCALIPKHRLPCGGVAGGTNLAMEKANRNQHERCRNSTDSGSHGRSGWKGLRRGRKAYIDIDKQMAS